MLACDLSQNMLGITHEKLNNLSPGMASPTACLAAVADHRFLPLKDGCIDLIVSGWSVSYLTVWYPDHWHLGADRWLIEAKRVLRKRGTIILFESLGTGNKSPQPLDHLKNFYNWLDENEFKKKWIRTDYQFESPEEAADISGFFFGNDMKTRILRERIKTLPECTGMWWMKI
jgi:ubiquinone/menaquinone biosynthesis C-methylase UbiE